MIQIAGAHKKSVTIAQFGVGYWGPNLLRNLISNEQCKVKAVVDPTKERRDFVTRLYPAVSVYEDVQTVLSDSEIDAVVIATPVALHFDLAIRALQAGKHVLVEKPLAKSVSEVEKIQALAEKKDLVAMVGHTFLFNAAVRYLKEIIDRGELGSIRYIYSQRLNLGRIRSDVDAFWNFGPHDISIIQYLLDNPTPISVFKQGMDYIQEAIDDVVFVDIVYPGKIMAHIHVSWLDPQKTRRMTIVGSKKMAIYDDVDENKITIFDKGIDRMAVLGQHMDFDQPELIKYDHRSGDILMPRIKFEEPLKAEIAHFIECILTGTECLTGADHALEVVRILSTPNPRDA